MKKFVIEDDFWSLFSSASIGVVICHGVDNSIKDEEQYKEMISKAEKEALNYLQNAEFSSNEVVKVWREAFQKFKTKKGARSSIEALLIGTDESEPPYEGEIVYKDSEGAICRCFKRLAKTVQDNLGGICTISILDINNREVSIE